MTYILCKRSKYTCNMYTCKRIYYIVYLYYLFYYCRLPVDPRGRRYKRTKKAADSGGQCRQYILYYRHSSGDGWLRFPTPYYYLQ